MAPNKSGLLAPTHGKMIFSQKDPAEWFKHQRFRKWETKTKIMALEFALDLFVEPGSTWKAVWETYGIIWNSPKIIKVP